MLFVRTTDVALRNVTMSEGSTVVIYDRHRNPIVVVLELQPGLEVIYTRTDPEFAQALRNIGLPPPGDTGSLTLR